MLQRSTHDLNSKVEGGDGYSPGCKTVNTISDLATRVCSLNCKCAALGNISQSNPCFDIIALDALTHLLVHALLTVLCMSASAKACTQTIQMQMSKSNLCSLTTRVWTLCFCAEHETMRAYYLPNIPRAMILLINTAFTDVYSLHLLSYKQNVSFCSRQK